MDCDQARIVDKRIFDYRSSTRLRIHLIGGALWFDTFTLILMEDSCIVSYWTTAEEALLREERWRSVTRLCRNYNQHRLERNLSLSEEQYHNDHQYLLCCHLSHAFERINLDQFDRQSRDWLSLFMSRYHFHMAFGSFLLHMVYHNNFPSYSNFFLLNGASSGCNGRSDSFWVFLRWTCPQYSKKSPIDRYIASSDEIRSPWN